VIDRLVVFGGTGDLSGRYLLPGLAALRARGHLSERFELVAASRQDWNGERFRDWAADWLRREAVEVDARARAAVVRSSRYQRLDLADPASVMACLAGEGPVAVYLALPPSVFATAVSAIHRVGLPADSQVALEKPFGEDLDSARALNRLLAQLADERHVFRVDHFLAMTTVQNVLGTRLANRVLEPLWKQRPHRAGRDHLGGDARARGTSRLLRPRRGAQGHGPEPSPAAPLPGGDGAADQPRRT
jgi:glucose-6-phosphate 1-dehydrogenase